MNVAACKMSRLCKHEQAQGGSSIILLLEERRRICSNPLRWRPIQSHGVTGLRYSVSILYIVWEGYGNQTMYHIVKQRRASALLCYYENLDQSTYLNSDF